MTIHHIKRDNLLKSMISISKYAKCTPSSVQTYDILVRIEELDRVWKDFLEIHSTIENLSSTNETMVEEENNMEGAFKAYLDTKSLLRGRLDSLTPSTSNPQHNNSLIEHPIAPNPKLPEMPIPKFNGEYENWESFRDLFVSIIHNQDNLSGARKLQYLKASLIGEAQNLISSFTICDANYSEAWEILSERYDNPRVLVDAIMRKMLNQPHNKKETSSGLRNLIDTTTHCLRSLKSLDIPTDNWDPFLIYIVSERLDPESQRQWEIFHTGRKLATFEKFKNFIATRYHSLEVIRNTEVPLLNNAQKRTPQNHMAQVQKGNETYTTVKCLVCSELHPLYRCPQFLESSYEKRTAIVQNNSLCFNCFRANHTAKACRSSRCRKCHAKHHTLLHNTSEKPKEGRNVVNTYVNSNITEANQILLSTALVNIDSGFGITQLVRLLLDSGSHATFISEACVQRLNIIRKSADVVVTGLGSTQTGHSHGSVNITLTSRTEPEFKMNIEAFIIPKITNPLPIHDIKPRTLPSIAHLTLADPEYHKSAAIDILVGADVYWQIITEGILNGTSNSPMAQNTHFGWILSGPIASQPKSTHISNFHIGLDLQLRKFWEIEEVINTDRIQTKEDEQCENIFENTYRRNENGRFIVNLPFKSRHVELGTSKPMALKRFYSLEKRLNQNKSLKQSYSKFMAEYLDMNHMEIATNVHETNPYYLPHHGVEKLESTTTKLRVVFDASAKTSSGKSLNDELLIGPKLQDDLIVIIMRFRKHRIAFTADIAKMFRQILIDPKHYKYQRILWRESNQAAPETYNLKTVTYGMASAQYLAVKSLQQLAKNEYQKFEAASKIVLHDFYVDDLMSGCDNETTSIKIYQDLANLLKGGGFHLRKWASNNKHLMAHIPKEDQECENTLNLSSKEDQSIKTLGLRWHFSTDTFSFKVNLNNMSKWSKRTILSEIAKLYDPLGWLSPCTIVAKIFMQKLWAIGVNWDECLPRDIINQYLSYRGQLINLEQIRVNRWYGIEPECKIQIHGFCDASEAAYAAVVYLRTETNEGTININIVTARTKVAPIQTVSLPRLELCGAVLLAKLIASVKTSLNLENIDTFAWTDSQIVLAWIGKLPGTWKTFVANRISTIQTLTSPSNWQFIEGKQNPADCASRGIPPPELNSHPLWWHGPSWLRQCRESWPKCKATASSTTIEEKKTTIALVTVNEDNWKPLLQKYSSLATLIRVTSYIFRFISNSRKRYRTGLLKTIEYDDAMKFWLKHVQHQEFNDEINCCLKSTPLKHGSKLISLNPFLDKHGILRVGGRIREAGLSYDKTHPIIIPNKNELTNLILTDIHINQTLHGNIQLMLTILRHKYWLIGGRSRVRQIVHQCITCFRHRRKTCQQLMGNLPERRVSPARAFSTTGVDFAGPFVIRLAKGRCNKTSKAYISIFVCFTTKAVHLELVSELTTDAFIAALRRFSARRGKSNQLYSDCGTNFVGASKKLDEMQQHLSKQLKDKDLNQFLTSNGISWSFIPPGSPNFGGLWEAGVKSIKYHLRRVTGSTKLTFEEMTTLLCQIESCLNSRPISAMSDDPKDMSPLTPAHFLLCDNMENLPEPDVTQTPTNRLNRWQLIQQLQQQYWRRWQAEYISGLQQRPKWKLARENIKIGDLVLVQDERLPPAKWLLGRVTTTCPGKDGKVRVVELKHHGGIMKRPISKICSLPTNTEN